MRFLAFVVLVLGLAGCAGPDRPVLLPVEQVGAAEPGDPPPAGPAPDGGASGLITPTGVAVAVLADVPDGYLVRTPCGGEAVVSWGTPVHQVDVVLDPGHGGPVESGAVGPNGLAERDLNLDIARRTATELARRGVTVALTRTGDYQVPLTVRAELAERLGADALVSIHHNAPDALPSAVPGTEVFVQEGVDTSRRLGGLVHHHVSAALTQFDVAWTAARDAGVLVVRKHTGEEAYGMIRYPAVPSVLAELAYLSNPAEAELLATEAYRRTVSAALADAVEAYFGSDDPGSGFVDQPRTFTPSGATGGTEGCRDPVLE